MKLFLFLAFVVTAAFAAYQNTVIKAKSKTLAMYEGAAEAMVGAHQAASARSNKWEQRYYSCIKLQVVSVP